MTSSTTTETLVSGLMNVTTTMTSTEVSTGALPGLNVIFAYSVVIIDWLNDNNAFLFGNLEILFLNWLSADVRFLIGYFL